MDNQYTALSEQDQLAGDIAGAQPQNKIAEFKQLYPAYKDVPDVQLADALHQKFYSDIPRDAYLVELGLADAGGAMSTSMDRAAYQKRFLADNPQATQGAVDAVLAQYDQQAAARVKAAADAPAAAAAKAEALKKMTAPQLIEKDFNDRLDARLKGKTPDSILPGYQQDTTDYSFHQPSLFDKTAGNLVGGALGTLAGAGAAGLHLIGDDADAAVWDAGRQQIAAEQKKRLGGDTFTGKVSSLVGGIVPALAIPEGMVEQYIGNAGLFAIPAFQDTYKEKLAQGYSKPLALAHAAEAFGINMFAPTVMQKGAGALIGKAATEGAPGLAGAALGLGQAAAEGVGFSALNSVMDKGTDALVGQKNDRAWFDPEDMLVQATGFGGMRGAHMVAHAGAGMLGVAQQQHLIDSIGKAGTVDEAIAAASAAVNAPASGYTADHLQNLRPLESGPMTWQDAIAQPGQAGQPADVGNKYVRVQKPDGTTGFELAPADPLPPQGGAPAQLGAQYTRIQNPDGSTGFALAPEPRPIQPGPATWNNSDHDVPLHVLGIEPQPGADGRSYARVQTESGQSFVPVDELSQGPSVWRRANDPTIPTLHDQVDHPHGDIPTLTSRVFDEAGRRWHLFSPGTGTLGIPRAEMPQIKAEHRGALVNFLNARGVSHDQVELLPSSLKPTQAEFSLDKVQKALDYQGGNRSILTSSDGHVLDGHHQWLGDVEQNTPTKAIRLNAPIRELLDHVREFPSATTSEGAPGNGLESKAVDPAAPAGPLNHLDAARQKHQRQDDAVAQAMANLEARKAAKAEPGTWQATDFAPRIDKMLGDLRAAGLDDHARIIEGGIKDDIKNGQLTEAKTAFREENARQALANVARNSGKAPPAKIEPMTADRMHEVADTAPSLPRPILEAAVKKWNPLAEQLAGMGFKFGEVHPGSPDAAREVHNKLRDIVHALLGLAPRRYQEAKAVERQQKHERAVKRALAEGKPAPKAPEPFDPAHLKRAEKYASETLGINTRKHLGVDTSNPISLGGGISDPVVRSQQAKQQSQKMRDRVRAADPFLAFLANHGISPKDRADLGVEPGNKGNRMVPGFGPVIRKTGKRLDELALLAKDDGFLTQHDIDSTMDTGGTRKLADMIQKALANKEVIQPPGMLDSAGPNADERLAAEAESLGINTEGKTADQLYDEVTAAHRAEEAHREATGAETVDEQALIEEYADVIGSSELADAHLDDIDLDAGSPSNHLTDEEIDAIFGIKNTTGPRADRGEAEGHAAGDPHQGTEGAARAGEETGRRPVEESQQDKSHREWRENYDRVVSADDLSTISSQDIERAIAYAARMRSSQQREAWAGDQRAKNLIDNINREIDFLKAEIRRRETEGEPLLKSYSRGDVLERQDAEQTAAKAHQSERDRLEAMRKREQDDKDVSARLDASAEHFQLGQDAHDSLAGQGDIFGQPAPAEGRPGYDFSTTVNARALAKVLEENRGAPLAEKPAKMEALRNGTAQPSGRPELAFRDRDGKLDVNDGRHRIALAAEQGKAITVHIAREDSERLHDALPLMPMTEKNQQRLDEGGWGWMPAHDLGRMSRARAERERKQLERDNPGYEYQVSGTGDLHEIEVRKRSEPSAEVTPVQAEVARARAAADPDRPFQKGDILIRREPYGAETDQVQLLGDVDHNERQDYTPGERRARVKVQYVGDRKKVKGRWVRETVQAEMENAELLKKYMRQPDAARLGDKEKSPAYREALKQQNDRMAGLIPKKQERTGNWIADELRRADPKVFSQGRVHAYDPENARPLLLIACAEGKLQGSHPAAELYQGAIFDVLRKWMPTRNPPDIYIISAKHGLVHATDVIETYDQRMTEDRARELMLKPVDSREFRTKDFSEVYVAGGKLYRDVGQVYAERLKKMGVLAPHADVLGAEDGDGIGDIRGHLGDYLRQLEDSAPAGAAELARKNDEHYQRVKQADAEARAYVDPDAAKRADYLALRDGGSIAVGETIVRVAKDENGWAFHAKDGEGEPERFDVKPASKENTAKAAADYIDQLRNPREQVPDLGGMFDKILAEEMKAKPAEDLGDMFDAILADEQQKAEQAKALQDVERMTAPATPRKPKAEPLAEGIPLSFLKRVNVDHNAYDHDAGRWETKNMAADKALRSVRDDISNLEAMLKCMKG